MSEEKETLNSGTTEPEVSSADERSIDAMASAEVEGTSDGAEQNTPEDGASDRFDKHPRFQELNQAKKAAEERAIGLEQKLAYLEGQISQLKGTSSAKEAKSKDYQDLTRLESDKIQEWFTEDPRGFLANLARQIRDEVQNDTEQKLAQKQQVDAARKTLKKYADENPDFIKMYNNGSLSRYIEEHPGETMISAHRALSFDAKKDQMRKEIEAELRKNQEAKRSIKNSGGEPARQPSSSKTDERLKDPSKFGGATRVLADRMKERREQR